MEHEIQPGLMCRCVGGAASFMVLDFLYNSGER